MPFERHDSLKPKQKFGFILVLRWNHANYTLDKNPAIASNLFKVKFPKPMCLRLIPGQK